jgi:hypothetical protein
MERHIFRGKRGERPFAMTRTRRLSKGSMRVTILKPFTLKGARYARLSEVLRKMHEARMPYVDIDVRRGKVVVVPAIGRRVWI